MSIYDLANMIHRGESLPEPLRGLADALSKAALYEKEASENMSLRSRLLDQDRALKELQAAVSTDEEALSEKDARELVERYQKLAEDKAQQAYEAAGPQKTKVGDVWRRQGNGYRSDCRYLVCSTNTNQYYLQLVLIDLKTGRPLTNPVKAELYEGVSIEDLLPNNESWVNWRRV